MTELPLQGEGLAVERIAMMRNRHVELLAPADLGPDARYSMPRCEFDHQRWPCDAAQLLAALQAEPSPETVERVDVERLADIAVMALGEVTTGAAYGLYHKSFREHFVDRLRRAAAYRPLAASGGPDA